MNSIWQHADWPNFRYPNQLIPANQLHHYAQSAGRLSNQLQGIPDDQRMVVSDLFSNGVDGDPRSVNRNKYVKRAKCSPSTALRDLQDLVGKSVLVQLPGEGRNTRYGLNLGGY